ncbi:MAG TPA: hypothetical protein VFZ00_19450 [Solirubrobacter sp.]|nr:hypothetical protein [Solirubrobacter sp.]
MLFAAGGDAREQLEVERVAAAAFVELRGLRVADLIAQQLPRRARGQRIEFHASYKPRAPRALERREQPVGHLVRAHRQRDQHRRTGRVPQQRPDQIDRAGVGPVQVVEDQHERRVSCEQLEQLADRAMGAIALVVRHGRLAGRERVQRRKDPREHGPRVVVERFELPLVKIGDVRVERVDEHPERKLPIKLGGAAGEHQHPPFRGLALELGEQARLAHPGIARQFDRQELPLALDRRHRFAKRFDLGSAPDDRLDGLKHSPSPRASITGATGRGGSSAAARRGGGVRRCRRRFPGFMWAWLSMTRSLRRPRHMHIRGGP